MTTAPAINNIADLYRIIDEQPEWAEALRSRLLGAELLAMPRQLAQLTAETRALREVTEKLAETATEHTRQLADLRRISESHTEQLAELRRISESHTEQLADLRRISENHTAQLTELTTQVKEHTVQLTELTTQVKEHTVQLTKLSLIATNHDFRIDRANEDLGRLKNMHSEDQARRDLTAIAGYADLFKPVPVTQEELMTMARQLGLDKDTRNSFVRADLVFRAQDAEDNAVYGAVEVSWTADYRDTNRARRNARLLQQATGIPAIAIVVSNRWERELDWTDIHWQQISE